MAWERLGRGLGTLHPHGSCEKSSWLPASDLPSPSRCNQLGSESGNGRSVSVFPSPPSVTDFSNKKHTFKKEYCTLTFKMIKQVILLEKLNIELLYDLRVSLPDILPQRMERENLKRYSHTSVHSSIIHNSPEVETTPIFTNRWGNSVCLFVSF